MLEGHTSQLQGKNSLNLAAHTLTSSSGVGCCSSLMLHSNQTNASGLQIHLDNHCLILDQTQTCAHTWGRQLWISIGFLHLYPLTPPKSATEFHSTASLLFHVRRPLLRVDTSRWLMENMWQLSAQFPINRLSLVPQYTSTAFFSMQVVRQQLHGSYSYGCRKLFVLHSFVACVVSFQITKPG